MSTIFSVFPLFFQGFRESCPQLLEDFLFFFLCRSRIAYLGIVKILSNQIAQQIAKKEPTCTSQQKVDTFFIFHTLKTGRNTPYIVLVSDNLMSMQVVFR